MRVGILAFHGDVIEHVIATKQAAVKLKKKCEIIEVRAAKDLEKLDGLIIPGGESTNFYKLCMREGMIDESRRSQIYSVHAQVR